MAVEKVSITLPAEVAENVRRVAERTGLTLSQWIADTVAAAAALAQTQEDAGLAKARAAAEEYEAAFGSPTPEEMAATKAELEAIEKQWTPEMEAQRLAAVAWLRGEGPHPLGLDPEWGTE